MAGILDSLLTDILIKKNRRSPKEVMNYFIIKLQRGSPPVLSRDLNSHTPRAVLQCRSGESSAVLHAITHIRKLNQAEIKVEAKDPKYSEGKHISLFIFHYLFQKRTFSCLTQVLYCTIKARRKLQEGKESPSVDSQDTFLKVMVVFLPAYPEVQKTDR